MRRRLAIVLAAIALTGTVGIVAAPTADAAPARWCWGLC